MQYLQLYKDQSCTDLYAVVPCIDVTTNDYSIEVRTKTLGGNTYRYIDSDFTCIYHVPMITSAPLLSYARLNFPTQSALYCKNGLAIRDIITTKTALRFQNYIYNGTNLNLTGNTYSNNVNNRPVLYAISFVYNGVTYVGFTKFINVANSWPGYIICSCCFELSFWENSFQPPYDYGGADDPDGGHGSGSYGHTGVTDTPAPLGLMPTGGRGLHYYKIDGPAYQSLQGFLWGDTGTLAKSLWAKFVNKTHTPVSCVVGCFALPEIFAPAGSGSSPIQLAGVQLSPISGVCVPFSPACVDVEYTFAPQAGAYKNFADYTHTTCKLYVPFCGSIPIPMELALNRTIKIRYRVDQANGNLCAAIFAGDCVVGELSGNCAYQIPVSGGDTGALEVLGATVTGLVQISTGDFRGALQSGAEALTAQHTTQLINGDLSGNVSYCSLRKPYIEYTRNATTYTEYYNDVLGIPARVGGTLQSFSGGYGQFEIMEKDINIPEATAAEKEEIASLLRGGVIV